MLKEDNKRGKMLRRIGTLLVLSVVMAGIVSIVKPGHEQPTNSGRTSTNIVKPGHQS